MEHYAGIDVSLELSSVCVVDATGQIVREAKLAVIAHAPRAGPAFPAAGCAGSYGEISVAPGLRM